MVAPTCFGITLSSSGSVPSAFILPGWPGSIKSPEDGQGTPETCRDVLNKITTV
jgi:hypothetical protein